MRSYKTVKCLKKIGIDSKIIKNGEFIWKAIIKEASEERMNREIQP